jgi:hypothetical protein
MVYTKRPLKSYGGRNCGHRKNICENHWSSSLVSGLPGRRLPFGWQFRSCFGSLLSSILWTCWNHLCLYVHNLSSEGVTWSSSKISSFLLWSRRVYPAVRCKYLISAVRSLFLSHCLIVQISLTYKRVGRANVLYNFNLVLLCIKFGFSVLFKSRITKGVWSRIWSYIEVVTNPLPCCTCWSLLTALPWKRMY